jgi:hypothetical protein
MFRVAALILLLSAYPAAAVSQRDLSKWCAADRASVDWGRCLGYVDAFKDSVGTVAWPYTRRPVIFGFEVCLPPNFDAEESIPLLVASLRKHGDRGYLNATSFLAKAFSEAHPCKGIAERP